MTVNAPTTALEALDVARSQLGVAEQPPGSNRNPYGAWYGMNGVAWCDEFFCWTDWKAGWTTGTPKFAATTQHAAWFQRNGAWLPKGATPPEGAAIFYDWGQGIAHIGRWEGLLPDGRISSLEGNTDTAGGSSGGRVMRQYRSRALIAGFGVITYRAAPAPSEEDDMVKNTLYAPDAGTDHGKVYNCSATTYEHVVDGHTELEELVRQWGPVQTINAVAWDHFKTGARQVGSPG